MNARRAELERTASAWLRFWQGGDLASFDELHPLDFVDHSPSGRGGDRNAFRRGIEDLYEAFPDFHGEREDLIVDEARSRVTIRWTARGHHEGSFLGMAPTGRLIRFSGMEILEVKDGKIMARWGEWDGLDLRAQLHGEHGREGYGPRHVLTILAVTDLARSVAFYRSAFGWSSPVEVPVYVEFALPDGRRLGLYERRSFASNTGRLPQAAEDGEITATELYLHCDELDETIRRLRAAGSRELSPRAPRPWGDEAAYHADPDGNVLAVATPHRGA